MNHLKTINKRSGLQYQSKERLSEERECLDEIQFIAHIAKDLNLLIIQEANRKNLFL